MAILVIARLSTTAGCPCGKGIVEFSVQTQISHGGKEFQSTTYKHFVGRGTFAYPPCIPEEGFDRYPGESVKLVSKVLGMNT